MKLLVNTTDANPELLDLSLLVRQELPSNDSGSDKAVGDFRDYSAANALNQRVRRTYQLMHTNQTVDFVREKHDTWLSFNHFSCTIMEALEMLNNLVDESDPDVDLPNIVHAFQTAERIRQDHPDKEWFQLTGLIHDLGKVMAFYGEPQWCVVGDTFPVGCQHQSSIVYADWSFKDNPDSKHEIYSTKNGMYKENCGLENILMSWGHDEYLYQVLKHNKCTIPKEGLNMIRFHSFYPWHSCGDYRNLTNEEDKEMLYWITEFNKYDLYTKSAKIPDVDALKPYYQGLIDKFCPGIIEF